MRASGVVARELSCPEACGILVPRSGIQPMSPVLTGGFLTTGLQSKPQSNIYCILNNDEVVTSYQCAAIYYLLGKTYKCK